MSEAPEGALPAHVPDWVGAQAAHDSTATLWGQVKPLVVAAGAQTATITEIESALAAYEADLTGRSQRGAETDANRITLAVPDLFDLFAYQAPTDTLRLDGAFRQLQIEAEYSDWAKARTDLDATRTVWNRLRPAVVAKAPSRPDIIGSATVAADVESALTGGQALIADDGGLPTDSVNLEIQAQRGLDLVDVCEQIFMGGTGCGGSHVTVDPLDGKCKLDGTTTNVGAACKATDPAACGTDQNASCLDEQLDQFPGGYCNVDPCTDTVGHLCPLGSSCVELNGENGQCFENCSSDSDCRTAQGYFCLDMSGDTADGGLWLSGGSKKICSRGILTCPLSPHDCPSARPHCVLPDDGGLAYVDAGSADAAGPDAGYGDASSDAAPVAPPTPTCVP
jgi:hypothetical protein